MKALILVGGEGTRLRPLTYTVPKAMLPILNKPFLEHVIQYLKKHNIGEVILAMCYLPQAIKGYFGNGERWGIKIEYVIEETPLGTAGAVKNAAHLLDDTFFVFNGDIFTDLNLSSMLSFHRDGKGKVTIALSPVEDPTSYGVVEIDPQGRVKSFTEKPSREAITSNLINAGVYVLEPEVLDYIPPSFYMFEQGLFPLLLERGERVLGFPFSSQWIDMGTPDKYLKLNQDLLQSWGATNIQGDSCEIAPEVELVNSVLGDGCQIGAGSVIRGSVLWQGVRVGEKATIKDAVLARQVTIGDNCLIDGCAIGERAIIGEGSRLSHIKVSPNEKIEPHTLSS
jgi:mannose-1-phosphate guanylyltransferase